MEEDKNSQDGFPVFKGLQKPLEFMGIRGRFLTLAAVAIGVSFVGFIAFSIVLGKLAGFVAMLVMAAAGLATIFVKQRGGLHNKKRAKGIYVYKNIYNPQIQIFAAIGTKRSDFGLLHKTKRSKIDKRATLKKQPFQVAFLVSSNQLKQA